MVVFQKCLTTEEHGVARRKNTEFIKRVAL
jgi:hypothetical protein